ncbi:MAG: hypothetical protein AAGD35_00605 [Actinomycetota bacterium]
MDDGVTPRIQRRLKADFGEHADRVAHLLEGAHSGTQHRERVIAAIVIAAAGDLRQIHEGVALSRLDWRDVLVGGDLADADWEEEMDRLLGPGAP